MRSLVFSFILGLIFSISPPAASSGILQKWDFGHLAYGAKVTGVPAWANGGTCDDESGCTFKDYQGVEYTTFEDVVVIKRFRPRPSNAGNIPFGITYKDYTQAVIKKASLKTGLKFICQTHKDNSNIEPGNLFCSAAAIPGDPGVWLNFEFGADGKLQIIELFTHYI